MAQKLDADVCRVNERGYGAAVHAGITTAKTPWVVYADADGSYDPAEAVDLLQLAIKNDADMALGSRMTGQVEKGAMPIFHRYLGTPLLTSLVRLRTGINITDCNSGMRCIKRSWYQSAGVQARGMEFATAILFAAAQSKARVVEQPIRYRPTPAGRTSHLHPIRDGLRHLWVILTEKL